MRSLTAAVAGVEHVGGTLPAAAAGARPSLGERRGLLVRLVDERGGCGLGEASPLPGYSPDGLTASEAALGALRPARLDLDAPLLPQVARFAATLPATLPAARFAVETALLDLAGQRLGVPLATLLGDAVATKVPLSGLVADVDPDAAVAGARALWGRGIGCVKLKVGRPDHADDELDAVAAIRAALPDAVLRLDANGAWGVAEARARLDALAPHRPALIEEPTAAAHLAALAGAPVPIALDESLALPGAAAHLAALADAGIARAVVLKPTLLGGLSACLALAAAARERDLRVLVSHCFDGPVAMAAAAALALACADDACGLDRHPALAAYPAWRPRALTDHAVVATAHPGLGLDRGTT